MKTIRWCPLLWTLKWEFVCYNIKVSFSGCCMICLKFSNLSHNMKALIILSHSRSPFFLLTYLYGGNELLWSPVRPFGVFSWEKTYPVSRELICKDTFTKISLSNIIKLDESDVEWQFSIQVIQMSAFWNYFWKREGSFKFITEH